MKYTKQFTVDQLPAAAKILSEGGTLAFPTETVFGLGASALVSEAIDAIFEAKGRPSDNPLIVHLASIHQLPMVAADVPDIAYKLWERFAPGPLTLVVPKKKSLPTRVTAGLDTVAIRFPGHPIAQRLLQLADLPIAAPSANLSGKPSGTRWQTVLEDLQGRIDGIVCVDGCEIGLESTVMDITSNPPCILRQGSISLLEIQTVVPDVVLWDTKQKREVNSPGVRHRHYQPKAAVRIVVSPMDIDDSQKFAYIGIDPVHLANSDNLAITCRDLAEYGARVYEFFRHADRLGFEQIYCQAVPTTGLGAAIMDRLRRASEES